MNIHQLSADSKMGCKRWKVVRQCITNAVSEPDCNCITNCVTLVIEAMVLIMHQKFLLGDAALRCNLNSLCRDS